MTDDTPRDFRLAGRRALAPTWRGRAEDNIDAIALSMRIEAEGRPATAQEQASLSRFVGFGAGELANSIFRDARTAGFRADWSDIGRMLEETAAPGELDALARSVQYAHFTPEPIVRALWAGALRLGFRGGRALDAGMGVGIFEALVPGEVAARTRFAGVEADPIAARIARLLQPGADVLNARFEDVELEPDFALAIGNPPYANIAVKADPDFPGGLQLHDYFILKSLSLLRPGGIGAFVTSRGTMDKTSPAARERMAEICDLAAAVRLPDGMFAADAGTDVGVDLLFFRRRGPGFPANDIAWTGTLVRPIRDARHGTSSLPINEFFCRNPATVLGDLQAAAGPHGTALRVKPFDRWGGANTEARLAATVDRLRGSAAAEPRPEDMTPLRFRLRGARGADAATPREGAFSVLPGGRLAQVVDGRCEPVPLKGKGAPGMASGAVGVVRALVEMRDLIRAVLRLQHAGESCTAEQAALGRAHSAFVAAHGPINRTLVTVTAKPDGGERRSYRYPNLTPFRDDPDCWLVASLERYDPETDTAERAAIFSEVVVRPPVEPEIRGPADALAVSLARFGSVDAAFIGAAVGLSPGAAVAALGDALFVDPPSGLLLTADDYLSGPVRAKLELARDHARRDPAFARNVAALEAVQPADVPPSDITAQLGAPWVPAEIVALFAREVLGVGHPRIAHDVSVGMWVVNQHGWDPEADARFGIPQRRAMALLGDTLNNVSTTIHMTVEEGGSSKSVLDPVATEAARAKVREMREAFGTWVWADGERTDALCRIYNDRYNDVVPRAFDGGHVALEGASPAFRFYDHQKRAVWRILAAGSTYIAHAVGAGKSASIAAAVMEQRRLGLVTKALLAVPGHCLAQAAAEFLALYPSARIIVADELNFARENRRRFLARAATGDWDCIVITHSALRFVPLPSDFEREFVAERVSAFLAAQDTIGKEDRATFRKLQAARERIERRLETLDTEKDDFLTLADLGVDQIIVDEAHEFRKLSFATGNTTMKGVDPDGSMMAWDLHAKVEFVRRLRLERRGARERHVDRAVILASGTPITNTMGELFTVQRYMDPDALERRGIQNFDAWAACFGDTRAALELQPSGRYKPVTRFSEFVNLPELFSLFRSFADVVLPADLRDAVRVPDLDGGERILVTAPRTPAFRRFQRTLDERIQAIEARSGRPGPGDDILLSVINDGRLGAIDLRMVDGSAPDDGQSKLNLMIDRIHDIHVATSAWSYTDAKGTPSPRRGGVQIVFSDLGTPAALERRGFSAYLEVRDQLVARGVPRAEIAFVQDCADARAKARLFAAVRAGEVRVLIGSSQKLGTGANVQKRLVALHHLDVPWLPSQIEQREGRIRRQGNENDAVSIFAYATLGSMDATMWQANERKARFIGAVMAGDRSVRRLEDIGEAEADQFAMAKAVSSGDPRLMQKAGLEGEVARLDRLRLAHFDAQSSLRRRLRSLDEDVVYLEREAEWLRRDAARRTDGGFEVEGRALAPTEAGKTLLRLFRRHNGEGEGAVEPAAHRGFPLRFTAKTDWTMHRLQLVLGGGRTAALPCRLNGDGTELTADVADAVAGFEVKAEACAARAAKARHDRDHLAPMQGQAFRYQGELDLKRAELAALDRSLALPTAAAVDAGEVTIETCDADLFG